MRFGLIPFTGNMPLVNQIFCVQYNALHSELTFLAYLSNQAILPCIAERERPSKKVTVQKWDFQFDFKCNYVKTSERETII